MEKKETAISVTLVGGICGIFGALVGGVLGIYGTNSNIRDTRLATREINQQQTSVQLKGEEAGLRLLLELYEVTVYRHSLYQYQWVKDQKGPLQMCTRLT
jgi:hypothetical protein